ncbi:mCG146013, partial [Mus musculus]
RARATQQGRKDSQLNGPRAQVTPRPPPGAVSGPREVSGIGTAPRGTPSLARVGRPTVVSPPGQAHFAGPAYPARLPRPRRRGSGVAGGRQRPHTARPALQRRSASTEP